jgi:hypothetical protein
VPDVKVVSVFLYGHRGAVREGYFLFFQCIIFSCFIQDGKTALVSLFVRFLAYCPFPPELLCTCLV